jgi:hypothetical protein
MPGIFKFLRKNGIPSRMKTGDSVMAINLAKLINGGVNIATGTDAGNIGTMHASSYLQELEAMQKAGLTMPQILKAATINPAIGFGKEKDWGSVEKNKTADLLLLNKNPLESLDNLSSIQFVFKNGKMITPDTLLHESPEALVQRQLNAYNAHNIDAFLETYADDVELINFPGKPRSAGKQSMRTRYGTSFKSTPDLYCEIVSRTVLGNKIIDHERVRANNKAFDAVAIYEVENGLIKRVTFIQ